jgi:Family of unknown function (DUF6328)
MTSAPVRDDRHLERNETHLERCDRNLVELLQEVRVVQTGVQVLFAFLLAAPLTNGFHRLGSAARVEYYVTLVAAGVAAILLIAPTAYHRALFRLGDKQHLVIVANRLTVCGIGAVGVAMVGAMVLVTGLLFGDVPAVIAGVLTGGACVLQWGMLPAARRRAVQAGRTDEASEAAS